MRIDSLVLFAGLAGATAGAQAPAPKAVLVTGASSGIGRAITERLASNGFFVFAGGRTPQELADLDAIANVKAVRLDVTSASDIAAAVQTVRQSGKGLYGVVNNAGILVISPLVEATEKEAGDIMNVNLLGPFRITKAFAPLLIESKGRVINIGSLNGIVAQPTIGLYSMTKHGIEAYSDALAGELSRLGVRVSVIEPGNYRTNIGHSAASRVDTSNFATSPFAAQMRGTINGLRSFDRDPPPDDVAQTVLESLNSDAPRPRYLVVPSAGQSELVIRRLLTELVQLNDSQRFRIERDSLVKLLDAALAAGRR
ncbi:MAG TPA: SDR family oxidoreductase [Gemmatimonadaceae bacterium]|nr:SDR family oxidoreductase [Gemmatimonadaceae bacterium]